MDQAGCLEDSQPDPLHTYGFADACSIQFSVVKGLR